jgi:hypothetical protein
MSVMLTAFRHDAHKFTGESHEDAREKFAGVPVNQSVPEGADGDAAALSGLSRSKSRPSRPTTTCSCSARRCTRGFSTPAFGMH